MVDGAGPGTGELTDQEWRRRFHSLRPGEVVAPVVGALLEGRPTSEATLVWRSELGAQTWRLEGGYLKWCPDSAGTDLAREVERLRWLRGRHPVPQVLDSGHDGTGQWMLTAAVEAQPAVDGRWRQHPEPAVRAIAEGLRRLHALPVAEVPRHWDSWVSRTPSSLGPRPPVDGPVLVHGDACSPNTLVDDDGAFVANVDVGDLAVGDRWADLAVGAMSLGWNYGPGWDALFYDAYGIEPDPVRIAYYRALWEAES